MKKTIGIIGGDLRQRFLSEVLEMPVVFFANEIIQEDKKIKKVTLLSELVENCDLIILPIPFSKDKKNIYSIFWNEEIPVRDFILSLKKNNIIIGGPFTKEEEKSIKEKGVKIIKITDLETFKSKNAIPTAEGVISEIICKLDTTIYNSHGLVLGYGYCGKRISKTLVDLGAKIDVYTEDEYEKKEIIKKNLNLLEDFNNSYDFIINTIPKAILLTEEILKTTNIFIDITDAYNIENSIFIKMRGIPGKYSPRAAGIIIGEIINDITKNIIGEKNR